MKTIYFDNNATTKVAEVFSDPPINYLTGSVQGARAHFAGEIEFPLIDHLQGLPSGQYTFGVRSNHLSLSRTSDQETEIHGKVELSEINGSETFIHVQHDNTRLVVQEDGVLDYRIGSEISIFVSPCRFFVYGNDQKLVASPTRACIPDSLP